MRYLSTNINFSDVGYVTGISQCFLDIIAPAATSFLLLIFGCKQLLIYEKYGKLIKNTELFYRSRLYDLQLFLHSLMCILILSRYMLDVTDHDYKGFMLLYTILNTLPYLLCIWLIYKERYYQLAALPQNTAHSLVLLLYWTSALVIESLTYWCFNLNGGELHQFVLRYIILLLLFIIGLKAPGITLRAIAPNTSDKENESEETLTEDEKAETTAFDNMSSKLRRIFPYIWPSNSKMLQVFVVICILLVFAGRIVNVYLPIYRKKLIDSLTNEPQNFRLDYVLSYVFFMFLQGGPAGHLGLFDNLHEFLWMRVEQYTNRECEVDIFRHLHRLSLRWHLQRKTGEVYRVLGSGADSINNLLNYIIFSIIPSCLDLILAIVFFIYMFNLWFGLIVFVTLILYIITTFIFTKWRKQYLRRWNNVADKLSTRGVDSLLNFETVKYYGTEQYEIDAYKKAIELFQKQETALTLSYNLTQTIENVILCSGLLCGSVLCVYLISQLQTFTASDFTLFTTYLMELYGPLNTFYSLYSTLQRNFVNMERMFNLLNENVEIVDAPDSVPLKINGGGGIEFKNVSFGYTPEKPILHNVSFSVPAGKTVAIVGPSGAGKSTIMRLLFRFYDVQEGVIAIDGQNIKFVTQQSLRKAIGVVPQDTVLFNNTIYYNIEYGKIGADADAVYEAARAADIHERILSFTKGYKTEVGERGLSLSGGEKQRVAIARTILKSPTIVLLDEATSALDTHTERNIQAAFAHICTNRTTVIIAHRLSTIVHADEILVMQEGSIVERGTHEELLKYAGGVYADMWLQQFNNLNAGNSSTNDSDKKESEQQLKNLVKSS